MDWRSSSELGIFNDSFPSPPITAELGLHWTDSNWIDGCENSIL